MKTHVEFVKSSYEYDGLVTRCVLVCCLDLRNLCNWDILKEIGGVRGYIKRLGMSYSGFEEYGLMIDEFYEYGKVWFEVDGRSICSGGDEYDSVIGEHMSKTRAEIKAYKKCAEIIDEISCRAYVNLFGPLDTMTDKFHFIANRCNGHIKEIENRVQSSLG